MLSVEAEPVLVLLVPMLSVEALGVVPAAAALVAIPILERHEVKKMAAAEEASNNIKFFLFILTIFLNSDYNLCSYYINCEAKALKNLKKILRFYYF